MKISRENYEVFFMDYLDGNLPEDQVDRFLDFLEQNPDLKAELQSFGDIELPVSDATFEGKSALYKTESDRTAEDDSFTAVAFMEGDLNEVESRSFLHQMERDPKKARDFDLLMKTKLQADMQVVYPFKQDLYKETASRRLIYWGSRVAAVLLVSVLVWAAFQIDKDDLHLKDAMQASVVTDQPKETKSTVTTKTEISKPAETVKPVNTVVAEAKRVSSVPVQHIQKKADRKPEPALVAEREQIETPHPIQPIVADLKPQNVLVGNLKAEIQENKELLAVEGHSKTYTVDEYLLQKVLKIEKPEQSVNLQTVFRSGLDLASNISDRRVSYETEDGRVSKIRVDTRLLAFSIPFRKSK